MIWCCFCLAFASFTACVQSVSLHWHQTADHRFTGWPNKMFPVNGVLETAQMSNELCIFLFYKLFKYALNNQQHTVYRLLPGHRHEQFTLTVWPRRHDPTLSCRSHRLSDCNVIIMQLFRDVYWLPMITVHSCVMTIIILYCIVKWCNQRLFECRKF